MSQWSLEDVAEKMRDIDFAMLSTRTDGGAIAARPMSNNRDVEYDGDSWFFAMDDTRMVQDILAEPNVGLSMQGAKGLLGKPPLFLSIEAKAEIVRDQARLEEHWQDELERWFEQGVNTPGLVLIKAHASRIHYWAGEDQGEIQV